MPVGKCLPLISFSGDEETELGKFTVFGPECSFYKDFGIGPC